MYLFIERLSIHILKLISYRVLQKKTSTKKFQHAPEAPGPPVSNVAMYRFSTAGARMAVFLKAPPCFHTTWVCLKMVSTPLDPMVLLIIIPIKWL